MKHSEASGKKREYPSPGGQDYILEEEHVDPAASDQVHKYLGELRIYMLSGEKTGEGLSRELAPLGFYSAVQGKIPNAVFPIALDAENTHPASWIQILEKLADEHFDNALSEAIKDTLPEIFSDLQAQGQVAETEKWAEKVSGRIQEFEHPQKEDEDFDQTVSPFQIDLLEQGQKLRDFTSDTAFQLLKQQSQGRLDLQATFLARINRTLTGLQELLSLEGGTTDNSIDQLDFADELISFDKIRDIAVDAVSSHLPQSRMERLQQAIQTLSRAQKIFGGSSLSIFTTEQIADRFQLAELFEYAKLEITSGDACQRAKVQSRKDLHTFSKTIAVLRIGELMIEQQYQDHLHDGYFDHFDPSHLSEVDLAYLPPTLVIDHARHLMNQSQDFLSLLADDSMAKVIAINTLDQLYRSSEHEDLNYLELASLAIFRRNSYVFQGGLDRPTALSAAFEKGLNFPGSAFWNILLPSTAPEDRSVSYAEVLAGIESRLFPRIVFEAKKATFTGSQINLQGNPSPDAPLSGYEQKVRQGSEVKNTTYLVTAADFLAMDPGQRSKLELIPPAYQSQDLIPLSEYLSLPQDQTGGKIPFIGLVDEQGKLLRAAVPVPWIQLCRKRLHYWEFLQIIAGVHAAHLQETLEEAKAEWEQEKKAEIEALTAELQSQFAAERSSDLEQAVSKILMGLLSENDLESALSDISQGDFQPKVEVKPAKEAGPDVVEAQVEEKPEEEESEEATAVIAEAWIETEDCTSCRDCVDSLPAVFKYNDDKQAIIHDAQGAPYPEIVKAAEKCPAACIHPGLPWDKGAKDQEKWVKRAEKFN